MGRLSRDIIHEILKAHHEGEKRSQIADRFSVDDSTVRYHVEQFENVYGSTAAIYSLIKPVQRVCQHPSLKCLVCGQGQDHIHRRELELINRLQEQVRSLGEEPTE